MKLSIPTHEDTPLLRKRRWRGVGLGRGNGSTKETDDARRSGHMEEVEATPKGATRGVYVYVYFVLPLPSEKLG